METPHLLGPTPFDTVLTTLYVGTRKLFYAIGGKTQEGFTPRGWYLSAKRSFEEESEALPTVISQRLKGSNYVHCVTGDSAFFQQWELTDTGRIYVHCLADSYSDS